MILRSLTMTPINDLYNKIKQASSNFFPVLNAVYNFKWENSQDYHEFKQYNECAITTDFFDIKKLCN
jgi:hypothetical protein